MPSVDVSTQHSQVSHRSKNEDEDDDESPIATLRAMSIEVDVSGNSSSPASLRYTNHNRPYQGDAMQAPATQIKPRTPLAASDQMASPNNSTSSSGNASSLRSLLGVPPSARPSGAITLGVPPSTTSLTAPAGIGGASGASVGGNMTKDGLQTLPSEIAPKRRKVVLGPGCSALDWARLKSTIPSRGFRKIKPSELKQHKSENDAWSAFNGKVYDMTPYLKFHPGGREELMRVAGRDGTRLFMLTHSWVNIDSMIDSCIVGILVSEHSP